MFLLTYLLCLYMLGFCLTKFKILISYVFLNPICNPNIPNRYNIRQLHANESLAIGEYADERLILSEEEEATLVSDSPAAAPFRPWPCLDCHCTNLPVISARGGGEIEDYLEIGLR